MPGARQGMVDLVGNNPLSPTFGAEDNEGRTSISAEEMDPDDPKQSTAVTHT